ncbi:hypothetical protein AB0K16_09520 [Nonomuraea jabiensis]|uniref:hypothetical protein n=1 Tax=Nonomuraea jabiensis TaxID=882448 RepID=UPI003435B0C3
MPAEPAADLARAVAFQHAFARRRTPREVTVPGGFAVLDERYPGSHDDNKLIAGAGRCRCCGATGATRCRRRRTR